MMSPSSLLARLGELKKWQEVQQERLLRQHNKRLQEAERLPQFEDMEGISRLNNDEEIVTAPKDFHAILEEKLAGESSNENNVNNVAKPKRPFLKKGSGLSRFRMTLEDQKRKSTVPKKKETPAVPKNKQAPAVPKNKQTPASCLKAPDVVVKQNTIATPVDTPNSGKPNVNSLNRRVIAQINRFTTGRLNENDDTAGTDRELFIFESLEKRAMNSSFSSTNSSIVRMLSSTPQKTSPKKPCKTPIPEETAENQTTDSELIEKFIYNHLQNNNNIESLLENLQNYQGANTPSLSKSESVSSCSSINSDDVQACFEDCEKTPVKQMKDAATCTDSFCENEDDNATLTGKELLITQKLEELEKEIERFRMENSKIAQLRRDLEIGQREFEREKKKLVCELENERSELYYEVEEERKKLARDRMVFEKYTKELKNRPNKQERAEISNLKVELANLKETQKLKDTKYSTTQARLRNQIKVLEKDKANLQEEVEKLTKQNAKLSATQKINSRPSDTKMLQEINKNLNKLAKDTKKVNKKQECSSESESEISVIAKPVERKNSKNKTVSFERRRKSSTELVDDETTAESSNRLFYGSGTKENDLNSLNVANSFEGFDIEKHYEEVFGRNTELNGERVPNTTVNESRKDDSNETVLSDGSKEIKYSNGNVKITSADGNTIKTTYYNGDIKETNLREGYIKYFYSETKAWQTTYADGTEVLEFPNGQIEKKLSDGTFEVKFPDGIVRKLMPSGREEITYLDGSVVAMDSNGDRVLLLPNGQKEIHTKEHKRREYPDGTVKILYPDGTQETRYSNGRIRIKDKEGKLLMDSFS